MSVNDDDHDYDHDDMMMCTIWCHLEDQGP